jgi:hypothetical protein
VVPERGCGHIGNETVAREPASKPEGFSMSARIVDLREEKKRWEHQQQMRAKYGSMMLAEMSFADEAEAVAADREVLPPNNPNAD